MAATNMVQSEEKSACEVAALPLSVRAHNVLKNQGIETIHDLVNADAKSLLAAQKCGKKTIAEIIACLKMMGLRMVNSESIFPDAVIDMYIASIQGHLAQGR